MKFLEFESCKADPNVWMRPAIKSDGSECHEVLLCTDDALVISENPENVLRNEMDKHFELKEESIGAPKMHLGGCMRKVVTESGMEAWSFSSSQCMQSAFKNVRECMESRDGRSQRLTHHCLQTTGLN